MKTTERIWAPQALASVMLLWALHPDNPYGYYVLLRGVCFGVFGFLVFQSLVLRMHGWSWILGITAFLYNPVFPVHMDREIWTFVNVATIGLAIMSIFRIPVQKRTDAKEVKE